MPSGARLFQAGDDVTLVARGEHGRALAEQVSFRGTGRVVSLPIPIVTEPAPTPPGRTTPSSCSRSRDSTPSHALTQLSVAPPSIAVVCLQNGVENERRVLRHFADTYGVCVMCPATQLEPGVIQVHSAPVTGHARPRALSRTGSTTRGRPSPTPSTPRRSSPIARPDIMRWKYRKLLMNLANAVEALCGPEGRFSPLAREAQREGKAALAAAGIDVASSEEDRARRGDHLRLDSTRAGAWQGRVELAEPRPRARVRSRRSSSTGRSCCSVRCTACPRP